MPLEDVSAGLKTISARRSRDDEFRDYYRGNHPIMFASPKFRRFYEAVMRRYRLNLCRPVVRGIASRLDIAGWDGDAGMAEWWEDVGRRLQNRTFREAVRQGDAYLLSWPRDTMSGPLGVNRLRADEATVVYSEENPDDPAFAVKVWQSGDLLRVNVYYPDRAERWVTVKPWSGGKLSDLDVDENTLAPYTDDGADAELAYEGTLAEAGQDGILPMQHLPWQPDDTPYGTSALADVLPVQDALNKHAIDLLVTSEQYGLPLRAALGFEVLEETHTDDDGNVHTTDNLPDYDPRIDYLLALPGEQSKLIQLPEADLTNLLEVKRAAISDATIMGTVPLSILAEDSGQIPSGVALRIVERPLTALVEDGQQDATVPLHRLGRTLGFDARPSWADPVQMDVTEKWELAVLMQDAGWPARQSLVDAVGLDPDHVDQVLAEATDRDETVAGALVRAEREGRDPAELLR